MRKVAIACLLVAAASVASATTTFVAQGTSSGGDPIYAEADFAFDNGLLTLTLTNLLENPTSVAQVITDFHFTVGTTTGTQTSENAPQTVSVANDNTFAFGATNVSPGWTFNVSSGAYTLNAVGVQGAMGIIGAPGGSTYANANGSIAGNTPHNPFVYQTATWVFNIPGVTINTLPTNVVFSFNTTAGDIFACDASQNFCASTPEPGSWLLLGSGLAVLLLFARKRTA